MNRAKKRAFKRELFDQFARIGKALASGPRLELIDLLSQAERSVEELADLTGLSFANVSQHLQVLRRARMVEAQRRGLYVYYRLADESVFSIWQAIRTTGELRLAEIEQAVNLYLKERETLEPVTVKELSRRLAEGSVVVIDVRPEKEYRAGHIPGALSVPVGELEGRLRELPQDREIVAYCRGPYCVQSYEAVSVLKRHGFKASRLEVGLPDWRSGGLRVVKGPGPDDWRTTNQQTHRGVRRRQGLGRT